MTRGRHDNRVVDPAPSSSAMVMLLLIWLSCVPHYCLDCPSSTENPPDMLSEHDRAAMARTDVDFGGMILLVLGLLLSGHPSASDRARTRPPSRLTTPASRARQGRGRRRRNRCACRCAGSVMPNIGSMHVARQQRDRQPADRIVLREELGLELSRYQRPARYMPNSPADAGPHRLVGRLDRKSLAQLAEHLLRAAAVEIAHDAVVVEDRHLVMRKHHRQEIAVRAARRRAPARRARPRPSGGGRRRCRSPAAHRTRGSARAIVASSVHHPHLVADAVVGGDVDFRRAGARLAACASISGAGG